MGLASSFLVVPVYRAEALVSISIEEDVGGLGGLGTDLGSIAAIAGLSVGGAGEAREEAIAFLRSRELGQRFLEAEQIQEKLLSARHLRSLLGWTPAMDSARAEREAFRLLDRKIRTIDIDRKSGLIRVGMLWTEPATAAKWSASYVALADTELRDRAMSRYQSRIEFLQGQLVSVSSVELRSAIGRLLEGQMRLVMAAESRSEFAFRVVDAPIPPLPSERQSPRRGLYASVGLLLTLTMAIALAVVRDGRRGTRVSKVGTGV
jgi:uncharacterized protein involved in exopolysaccharide biosynthesis